MASYLKFDGKLSGAIVSGFAGVPSDNFVLTALVRFLSFPTNHTGIIQVTEGTSSRTLAGIWLRGQGVGTSADKQDMISVNWRHSAGGISGEGSIADTNAPIRLERVYKIQLIVSEANGIAVGVDGVRVATAAFGGDGFFLGTDLAQGYALGGNAGAFLTTPTSQRAHNMDILEAMIEVDRTLSTSGGFPVVDADTAAFSNFSIGTGSTADSALWHLDDGSGSTAADASGNGRPLDVVDGATWAPAADPTIPSPGIARWDFASIEGYALRDSDAPTIVPVPIYGPAGPVGDLTAGELRLAHKAPIWWVDGERTTQFGVTTQLTADTGQVYATIRALKTDGAAAISNGADIPLDVAVADQGFWIQGWLYDPGGSTAGRLQRLTVFTALNAIILSIGVFEAQSTTHYVASIGASHASTGVARSVGWHELLIYILEPTVGNATIRFYMPESGTTAVRTETATDIAPPQRLGFRQLGASASNDHGFWDNLWLGYGRVGTTPAVFSGIVEATGTRILPLFQPVQGVKFFRNVTITERVAGTDSMSLGTHTAKFRHSTDGGSSWSSSLALTTANLRARQCAANGDDVLEITTEMSSSMDDMGSPALTRIDVGFEPATAIQFADEEYYPEAAYIG